MSNTVASDELRLLLERIERLEEEKKAIAEDIKDVYGEAKSRGFDTKTMREIIKLRKMDPHARREREALLDAYKAALGMLDGTPLGRWAVERLHSSEPDGDEQDSDAAAPVAEDLPATIEDAKAAGTDAARAGKSVTTNPFPARDLRRAAWDEAWCAALGSDGMDIPEAWRPTKKPAKEVAEQ